MLNKNAKYLGKSIIAWEFDFFYKFMRDAKDEKELALFILGII